MPVWKSSWSTTRRNHACRAVAVVNPNRKDDASPHKTLAAVGVTFLLVVAVNQRFARPAGGTTAAGPELSTGSTS